MNTKILGIFVIFLIISVIPIAEAQISIGEKAKQELVEITIDSEGIVKVIHVVNSSNQPKQVDFIEGKVSNLLVTNELGDKKQANVVGDNIGLLILPSNEKTFVEYNLEGALSQEDGIWKWDFRYLESTNFITPPGADLLFVNDRPLYLQDEKGFRCHGCQMLLEYSTNESKHFEEIIWEDRTFLVEIRTLTEIKDFVFNQPEKRISFNVNEDNQFITAVIPLELLWEPYTVLVNDEKILRQQFFENDTHVWLNVRPDSTGEISIIGTTAIPEFPIVAPLALGLIIVLALPLTRKFNLR